MLRYKPLPLIARLHDKPEELQVVGVSLIKDEKFQLVLFVLRDLESFALTELSSGKVERSPDYYLGILEMVRKFREAFRAFLPDPAPPDWADEVVEDIHPDELR